VAAGLALQRLPVGEEGLQRRRERGHGFPSRCACSLSSASAISSGAADRYQYVCLLRVGMVLTGVFTSELSWRWVLFVNVPIGVGLLAATVWLLNRINVVTAYWSVQRGEEGPW
jgi:MFS family permease